MPKRLPDNMTSNNKTKRKKNNTVPKNKEGPERRPNNSVDPQIMRHNKYIYIYHVYTLKKKNKKKR